MDKNLYLKIIMEALKLLLKFMIKKSIIGYSTSNNKKNNNNENNKYIINLIKSINNNCKLN